MCVSRKVIHAVPATSGSTLQIYSFQCGFSTCAVVYRLDRNLLKETFSLQLIYFSQGSLPLRPSRRPFR
jgi:hypothetical protein